MPETEGALREQAETPLQNDDFSETFGDPDRQENEQHIDRKRAEKKLGATVLSSIGFERRHDIVKSSFDKARQRGDKLDGKNNDRRNYAYIERLENLIGKHGNDLEKRLWRASASKLIIKPENIQDSYWRAQEQALRDDGQGREISDYEKEILTEDILDKQKTSIQG